MTEPPVRSEIEPQSTAWQPSDVEPSGPINVWFLTNSPSPYQLDLFRALVREGSIQPELRLMRDNFRGGGAALTDISHKILPGFGLSRTRDEVRIHPGALREAFRGKHDAFVLSGLYTSPTFLMSAFILWIRRKPIVMWLERPKSAQRSDLKWWVRLMRLPYVVVRFFVLWFLFRVSRRIISMGKLAVQQYSAMGANETKLRNVPYCCDVDRFHRVDPAAAAQVRSESELGDRVVFLHSGQLIHRKGVDILLVAFAEVSKRRDDVALVLLGDGAQRESYERQAEDIRAPVVFAGHQPQDRLPAFFAAADVFVIASRHDGWAVVVNEACGASLPIIASEQTGAAHDLVADDQNGFLFDALNPAELSDQMLELAADVDKRRQFGERSREVVQKYSAQAGAQRLSEVLTTL